MIFLVYCAEFWRGSLQWPDAVFDGYKSDFDVSYSEGTFFNLTLHPQVIGRRSCAALLEKLITSIKCKEGLWFATLGDIASYVKDKHGGS